MDISRRTFCQLGAGAAALALAPALPAFASTDPVQEAILAFTGGAAPAEGDIELTTPEIAENGNTVPIGVDAPGATQITLFADGNPVPNVATFNFGPLSASRSASTRIRLATTQNVIAVAKMEDGSFQMAKAEVKVTIGGCGG